MNAAQKFIRSFTRWSKSQEDVCALILLGSHAGKGKTDRMSDIDLCLFVAHPADFINQQAWLHQFAPVWVSVIEHEDDRPIIKVIFAPGLMVEISIYSLDALIEMRSALPPYLEPGYEILVDKDKQACNLPKASRTYTPPENPTPEAYLAVTQRFWFNAFNTARYIWRGELWRAKTFDWQLKQDLLQMMGWHAALCRGQANFTTYEGKHLQDWTDPETYAALKAAFGRFDPSDSWLALEETIKIFTRLSKEAAVTLEIDYPQELEANFIDLIADLRANSE